MISQATLSGLARHWRMLIYVINVCRFSLIVLAAGALMLNVGQGQDLLIATAEDGRTALLLSSCLLWAFSIWLWTRVLLDMLFPDTPRDWALLAKYRLWMPRVLGALPFVIVALSAYALGSPADRFVWPTLIVGALFVGFVVLRRKISRLGAGLIASQPKQSRLWVGDMPAKAPPLMNLKDAYSPLLGRAALLLLILGTLLFVWGLWDPLSMGARFNALALLMVWGATFLPIGSLITYWANREQLPLLTALIVLMLIFSFWNDNHAIRPILSQAPLRLSAAEAVDAWAIQHCKGRDCGPFVVVATAGGGIRAGYWTGTVLGRLDDGIANFHDRVFAVSGVSGGSVGAAVYRGVVAGAANGRCLGKVLECSTRVLSGDFLSPLTASLLYRDLLQRLLPLPLLPDRAQTLETAWERRFASETGSTIFADSFSALGADKQSAWPALFLNATWSENGRRIVAATVNIDGDPHFKLANDQLASIGYDVRISTAAHNSARFPYVSPPGSWHAGKNGDPTDGKIRGRLQDGGLFENYGAVTAIEILNLAEQRLAGRRYTPVVILISSDPALPEDIARSPRGHVHNFAYEMLTTLSTMSNTRVGHGDEAASELRGRAERRGRFAYFRMCDPAREEIDPPLGWALSQRAQTTIQSYLLDKFVPGGAVLDEPSCRKENQRSAKQVCEWLSADQRVAANCSF